MIIPIKMIIVQSEKIR